MSDTSQGEGARPVELQELVAALRGQAGPEVSTRIAKELEDPTSRVSKWLGGVERWARTELNPRAPSPEIADVALQQRRETADAGAKPRTLDWNSRRGVGGYSAAAAVLTFIRQRREAGILSEHEATEMIAAGVPTTGAAAERRAATEMISAIKGLRPDLAADAERLRPSRLR